jgi:hypothetical protein
MLCGLTRIFVQFCLTLIIHYPTFYHPTLSLKQSLSHPYKKLHVSYVDFALSSSCIYYFPIYAVCALCNSCIPLFTYTYSYGSHSVQLLHILQYMYCGLLNNAHIALHSKIILTILPVHPTLHSLQQVYICCNKAVEAQSVAHLKYSI